MLCFCFVHFLCFSSGRIRLLCFTWGDTDLNSEFGSKHIGIIVSTRSVTSPEVMPPPPAGKLCAGKREAADGDNASVRKRAKAAEEMSTPAARVAARRATTAAAGKVQCDNANESKGKSSPEDRGREIRREMRSSPAKRAAKAAAESAALRGEAAAEEDRKNKDMQAHDKKSSTRKERKDTNGGNRNDAAKDEEEEEVYTTVAPRVRTVVWNMRVMEGDVDNLTPKQQQQQFHVQDPQAVATEGDSDDDTFKHEAERLGTSQHEIDRQCAADGTTKDAVWHSQVISPPRYTYT